MYPKLSILVPALIERHPARVVDHLKKQAKDKPVQLVILTDNRAMPVGLKRNILLASARGDYFAFVDDDDQIETDYIDTLLEAIGKAGGADVICFRQVCRHIGTEIVERCKYGLGLAYTKTVADQRNPNLFDWTGLPAHTMCWRTELVNGIEFPEANFGEDVDWVKVASACAKTEYQIDKVLYYYLFDKEKSATRS